MALIKCPECGTDVSDLAISCPKCAYPIREKKSEILQKETEELDLKEKEEEDEEQKKEEDTKNNSESTAQQPESKPNCLSAFFFLFLIGFFIFIIYKSCDDNSSSYSSNDESSYTRSQIADSLDSVRLVQTRLDSAANSETISQLKPFFNFKKDDFNNSTWVRPKSAPAYTNQNGFFLYFQLDPNNVASNLRLRIQYTAYDWLFFHTVHLAVDQLGNGNYINFSYTPDKTENDCGNGGQIWEWSDEYIDSETAMLSAIRDAEKVKLKFEGRQYSKEMSLTKQQIKDIDRTMALYYAYGGK